MIKRRRTTIKLGGRPRAEGDSSYDERLEACPTRGPTWRAWRRGESRACKLRCEGFQDLLGSNMASVGGVIRDHNGTCISGFAKCIGSCSVSKAEAWGALEGLQQAWKPWVAQSNLGV
ncbi:hypothetical protein PVK06_028595 [Gossypium arboreum]|uniref:RNase H type-1 domain-containing protein n=1 Tax=Gossypium arboreum TaxID=29729 RepID=A0ABR0P446_GOSAR|nr:hypothetical protein PVK06_028595 [Gossypium arboreum]